MDLFKKIIDVLDGANVPYELKTHAPTVTSEDSARERGEPLKIGAKALLLKTDYQFVLCILPANRKLDMTAIRARFDSRNLRFATIEELHKLTGCPKGAVPPFGHLFGIDMIVDEHLFAEEYMAFNAGQLDKSIKMKTADFRKTIEPVVTEFCTI